MRSQGATTFSMMTFSLKTLGIKDRQHKDIQYNDTQDNTLIVKMSVAKTGSMHGETLANRTKPGPGFQLQTSVWVYILEFHTHLQNGLTYCGKLGPNKF